jgi:hypothetical protein
MIMLLLIYLMLGILWLFLTRNSYGYDNPIQTVFVILFWPIHFLLHIIFRLWS